MSPVETKAEKEAPPVKASISLANLKHALKVVGSAIQRTATIPILQCIRMEQLPTGLALEGTDLDISIRATAAETSGLEKALVMPAEKLIAWTKLLTGEDVKISATTHRATLQCGRPKAVLPIVDASTFPQLSFVSKNEGITLKQGNLARALRFAQMSVSTDSSRYTLNGILIQGDGEHLRMVATDGHRMTVYNLPCEEKIADLLAPSRFVKALLPMLSDEEGGIDLAVDDEKIVATIAAGVAINVASRKMTGQFPKWENVFPKNKISVRVDAGELLSSLGRCIVLSDEKSCAIDLIFEPGGQLTIKGASADNGEAEESIQTGGAPESEFHTRVNGAYLHALLKILEGDITICLPETPGAALLFKATPHEGETLDYVLMPMRV